VAQRQAVVDGVAAYLADQDADVYNIVAAAVRDDAVAAALHLTALAAAAVPVRVKIFEAGWLGFC
jgi:hypothetical protein